MYNKGEIITNDTLSINFCSFCNDDIEILYFSSFCSQMRSIERHKKQSDLIESGRMMMREKEEDPWMKYVSLQILDNASSRPRSIHLVGLKKTSARKGASATDAPS